MIDSKKCKECGALLTRKRKNGKLESSRDYNRRQFCDNRCAAKFQHSKRPPEEQQIKDAAIAIESEDENAKKTAKEVLEDIINKKDLDPMTVIAAARALLPYQASKTGDKGKKQTKGERAASAATGRFASGTAPRLVQGGKG